MMQQDFLRTSIRSKGLTLFLEPKTLYNSPKAATPIPDDFAVPFGKARISREGKDFSIITYGNTTHMCLEVLHNLKRKMEFSRSTGSPVIESPR